MTDIEISAHTIDNLLDHGWLEIEMRSGKWWELRRNGATRRWKRDPDRFYVGVKAGLRCYAAIAAYSKDLPRGGYTPTSPHIRVKL